MKLKRHLDAVYKSGLEERFQEKAKAMGYDFPYEMTRIKYIIPESKHTYSPDFEVTNNVYIETKGLWSASERKKACLINTQHPNIKILYVLYRNQKLSKKSATTYLDWAKKQGLLACTFKDEEVWTSFIKENVDATTHL